ALEATLAVLARHLPTGPRSADLQAAVAAGYARALRRMTLVEQERLARAIIVAKGRAEQVARQSEARFRAIFEGAAVGIGISDNRGRIVQVNHALADMLGYTREEMHGLTAPDMAHPTDPPEMWALYA